MSLKSKRKANISLEKDDSEDLFLSQPKKTKKSQSKKEDDELKDDSLFGELINKAGYILKKGDQPNLLSMYIYFFSDIMMLNMISDSVW